MKTTRLLWVLILFPALCRGQFPAFFGQYMFTGVAVNPAYAGSTGLMNATLVYRNQWVGFPGAPETEMLTWHAPLKDKKNNVGFIMGHDRLGVTQQFLLSGIYAYRIDAGKFKIAMGVQGGLSTIQNRWENLDLPVPDDGAFPINTPAAFVPQVGTGIYLNHPNFYAGISIPELIKIKGSQYMLFFSNRADYRLVFATAGAIFKVSDNFRIKPSMLMKYARGNGLQADFNMNLLFVDRFWLGASFRTRDAVVGIFELQATDQIRVGYAYECSISPLRYFNSGTHEIILSYDFRFRLKTAGPRYF